MKLLYGKNRRMRTYMRENTLMLLAAADAMPFEILCNVCYAAIADRDDIDPEKLEELSNKLGRTAWDQMREK